MSGISARDFAEKAHLGQRYGDKAYFSHLQATVEVLKDFGYDGEIIEAGWLHDTLEDTKTTRDQLYHLFGQRVKMLVEACTGVGANRRARNASIYKKIALCIEAAIVKVADRIANVEACAIGSAKFDMYKRERQEFYNNVARFAPYKMQERLNKAMDLRTSIGYG